MQAKTSIAVLMFFTSLCAFGRGVDLSRDKVLYLVGYAHLDTQWLWTYKVSIDEFIRRTLDENFALLRRYPAYNFNFTGSIRYEMMKEYYPERYALLKEYIHQNRWFVSGSSVDEGDVNVPSPEAIFRQILLGNNYFRKEFNRESVDYMLPDCFGFPASMPSIWAHAGLKGFSTQKLTWGSAVGIPFNLGIWEGPDGKGVVAALNPGEYVGRVNQPLNTDPEWIERVHDNGQKYGVFADYHYYGVGDQGGAPRESDVKNVLASLGDNGPIKVITAASDQLYKDLSEEQKSRLPRYKGDMLLTQHSAGTLSSQAYMKRWNRHNELLADSAERAGVMAQVMMASPYPQEKINRSWLRVLGSQMHDILPGTSIPQAYEYSYNDEVLGLNGFASSLTFAAGAFVRQLSTDMAGIPLVVYNPLSFARRDVVETRLSFEGPPPPHLRIFDHQQRELVTQIIERSASSLRFIFLPELSPLSYEVFEVRASDESPRHGLSSLGVSSAGIGNDHLRVAIDSAGDISSIRDRDEGDREILSAPARLVFQYEQPSEFPSWNMDWKDRQLPPFAVVDGPADIRVVEKGPLRVTVEIHRQKLGSTFIQRVSLVAGSRLVSIHTAIDWLTKNSSLKASFPFTLANPLATYNWGLGTVQRGTNNPRQYEVPSHQWSDLSAPDARYGVSILEDSKFGSDKPSDHEMRLTLLYTPNTEKGGYHYEASQDWGHHDFTYALYPHAGDWRQGGTAEQGERLNQAPKVFTTEKHSGRLGRRFSFLEVSSAQIAVRAVKKAEANTSIIVRLQELWGQDAQGVKIRFAAPLARAWEVDGQERKIGEASFSRDELTVDFSRYSPRSFALEFSPSVQAGTAARSLPLALAYTADVVSLDGEKTGGAMSEDGARYPGEQFPRELESEGIRYQLGEAGNNNVLFADGQSIELPAGEFNRLYVLAAAREDTNAEFLIDGVAQRVEVPQWYGKIGDYDTRIWGPRDTVLSILPGFIKRSNVAWFATHRHLAGGTNDSYTFSYLFSYALALGPQARTLTLPKNNKLGIFALTLAADLAAGVLPAAPLYDDFSGRVVVQPSKE